MFCSNCGRQFAQEDKFCSGCGKEICAKQVRKVEGSSSDTGSSTNVPVKSFASYKRSKGKEWKSKVSKSSNEGKKKVQDVVVNIGLMEWHEKEQILKARRGKRVPIRIPPTVNYCTLREEAEKKWRNFHSNLYDESQLYHLVYEDGQKAVFLPGLKKESFTLSRYQEEIGKDFKRISLFLCSNHDFQIAEGCCDDEDVSDLKTETDNTSVVWSDISPSNQNTLLENDCLQNNNPSKRLRCNSPISTSINLTTIPTVDENDTLQDDPSQSSQLELDQQFASYIQEMYDTQDSVAHEQEKSPAVNITDSSSVVKALAAKVDECVQLFIVVRRGASLNRVLSIWNREVKKNPASVNQVVRVRFIGEQGIDSGAMSKEFFTITLPNIGCALFPNGQPVDSTLHVQNRNFKACGEIVATSLAQGGPAPRFLEESVYGLMVNPNVPLQELDPERHLTSTDRVLLNSIGKDVTSHIDTIIEHGYTGSIDDSHVDEIIKSVVISIVTKRLVYLKEFMDGLDAYGLGRIISTYPEACKALFMQDAQSADAVDANYLISILQPEYSKQGSTRKEIEESMMDFLQDFLFHLEDEREVNVSGYADVFASCDDSSTGIEVSQAKEQLLFPDCTPAGIMGWLTGQKHRPISGELVKITVKFNHDCTVHNPQHRICFPVVGACAKEVSFPVTHMKTAEEFNEVLMMAICKGQSFGKA